MYNAGLHFCIAVHIFLANEVRNEFVTQIDHANSKPANDNHPWKWRDGAMRPILEFYTPEISLERLKLETSDKDIFTVED